MASNTTATSSSRRCDACRENVGLWHAAFTSECAHTFHLRCVSGIGACPSCGAQWKDAPAAAPAPPPATPFIFGSTAGLFGKTSAAAANSSSSASTMTGAFGVGHWSKPAASPFSSFSETQATTTSSLNFSLGRATETPPPSRRSQHSGSGRSLFGTTQQAPPATPNPFWIGSSPPAAQSPPPPPSCCVCGGAMGPGQATVTSECAHTFHLRCFSGSVCPVCAARWRDEVTVTPSPPTPPLNTPSSPSFASAGFNFAPPESKTNKPFSSRPGVFTFGSSTTPSFAPPDPSSSPHHFTFPAPPNPSSSPAFGAASTTPSFATPDPSSSPSMFSSSASFTFAPPDYSPSSSPAFGTTPSSMPAFGSSSSPPEPSPFAQTSTSAPHASCTTPASTPHFSSGSQMPSCPSMPSRFDYSPGRPDPFSSLFWNRSSFIQRPTPSSSSTSFNDDEPVDPPAHDDGAQESGALLLTTHCEIAAVARDAAHDGFAVVVHTKAPAAAAHASARAALDLVTVLDVSGSMEGTKLALLKQAMGFVIENLGPRDRLRRSASSPSPTPPAASSG
ncbi:unnamed protein product [Urochloa humidicola]